jgi:EpsI family protein
MTPPPRMGWTIGASVSPWKPDLPPADKSLLVSLRRGQAEPVDLLINYYSAAGKDHSLVVTRNRLWDEHHYNLVGDSVAYSEIGRHPVRFVEFLLNAPGESRLVWWSYWKDGQFTDSGTAIKWMAVRDVLRGDPGGAALVALSVRLAGSEDEARTQLKSAAWALSGLAEAGER